jgi:hypothetical protein
MRWSSFYSGQKTEAHAHVRREVPQRELEPVHHAHQVRSAQVSTPMSSQKSDFRTMAGSARLEEEAASPVQQTAPPLDPLTTLA